jgi:uncharacterized protein
MHRNLAITIMAMGAALMPAAAFCQAPSETANPVNPANGQPVKMIKEGPAIELADMATPEQVDRLFEVLRVRQQLNTAIKQMSAMMQQQVAQTLKQAEAQKPESSKPTPEQQAARDQLTSRFMDQAAHLYSVDEMMSDIKPIYRRHISKSDIEAFIAFFGSSAGQDFLDQQPLISKEYMPIVMARVQEKTKTLAEELKKQSDELDAKDKSGAGSDAPKP